MIADRSTASGGDSVKKGMRLLFGIAVITFFVTPVFWMVVTSLKSSEQLANRPKDLLPTTAFAPVDDSSIAVRVLAEVEAPAVLVNEGRERILMTQREWDEGLEGKEGNSPLLIETFPAKDRNIALVQPEEPGTKIEPFALPSDQLSYRLDPRWENYPSAMEAMKDVGRAFRNTLLVCLLQVLGQVVSASIAAYGFSILKWRGREAVFSLLLATMMVPFPILMIPLYDIFRGFGWLGSLKPLWVPALFASAFNVFLLRQFFLTLPTSLFEAARLEGCSDLRILWSIVLPLSKPVLTTLILFQFLFAWNDFLGPLIFLTDQKDYTISLALQVFQSQHGGTDWNLLMAASALTAAPVLALFFVAQRFFIRGAANSGMR